MIEMNPLDFGLLCATIAAFVGYGIGLHTARCSAASPCPKCAFHANERRVAEGVAKAKARETAKDQASFRHEYEHRGGGWREGDPDRFDCPDVKCPRNRHRDVDSDVL